jgi:hypothetical protein
MTHLPYEIAKIGAFYLPPFAELVKCIFGDDHDHHGRIIGHSYNPFIEKPKEVDKELWFRELHRVDDATHCARGRKDRADDKWFLALIQVIENFLKQTSEYTGPQASSDKYIRFLDPRHPRNQRPFHLNDAHGSSSYFHVIVRGHYILTVTFWYVNSACITFYG